MKKHRSPLDYFCKSKALSDDSYASAALHVETNTSQGSSRETILPLIRNITSRADGQTDGQREYSSTGLSEWRASTRINCHRSRISIEASSTTSSFYNIFALLDDSISSVSKRDAIASAAELLRVMHCDRYGAAKNVKKKREFSSAGEKKGMEEIE